MGNSLTLGIDDQIIPTFLFNLVVLILEEKNINPEQMLKGTQLTLKSLKKQQTRISFRQATTLLQNALTCSEDPALGLTLAKRESISDWGILGYALASCKSGEEAIRIGTRYNKVSTFLTEVSYEKVNKNYLIRIEPLFSVGNILPLIIEETIGSSIALLRKAACSTIAPASIQLSYEKPDYSEQYEEFFCCPVQFNSHSNIIVWDIEEAQRPFPQHNPATAQLAIELCETLMNDHYQQQNLIYKIRCRLLNSPGNYPTMNTIAKELNISERTLRRTLKELGTSYQNIFNDVREKLAIEYLKTSELTLDDIAYLVGFSDAGNFHRAFKKWTGKPPSAFK